MRKARTLALAVLALAMQAVPARAATIRVEGVTMSVPPGWRSSRGATTDGVVGQLIEATSVADGEESFVLFSEPLLSGDLETTARQLQKKTAAARPQVTAVEKLRLFHLGKRPGIRAEMVGTDPWGGEPARVVFWVVANTTSSALVFRAVLLNSRYAGFASLLEDFVRSWKFDSEYIGPRVVLNERMPENDAWHEGMRREESFDSGWSSENIGVQVEVSEGRIPDDPYNLELPIDASSLDGNFCYGQGAAIEEALQFDGTGQWSKHLAPPPEKFSLSGVKPDRSGFYKIEGTSLVLRPHIGAEIRCTSARSGVLRCSGKEYDRALCR